MQTKFWGLVINKKKSTINQMAGKPARLINNENKPFLAGLMDIN